MRVLLVHHPSDQALADRAAAAIEARGFEPATEPAGSDLALLLVSRAALREGLGARPREALAAGLRVLTIVVGDDVVPAGFPVSSKHVPRAAGASDVVRILERHRDIAHQKIADSKQEMLGYGLLLALLARQGS